jgi:hypothetical protein
MTVPAYDAENIPFGRQWLMILERLLYSLLSLLLGVKIRSCHLVIKSFHFPCTFDDIRYSESWSESAEDDGVSEESNGSCPGHRTDSSNLFPRDCTISISQVRVRFHFPRASHPRWATIEVSSYDYTDRDCHASADRATISLLAFPVLFRRSYGPWVSTAFHGLHLRVFTSRRSPAWVAALRNDFISTLLEGDILRINDICTTVEMNTTPVRGEHHDRCHTDNDSQPEKPRSEKTPGRDKEKEKMVEYEDGLDHQNETRMWLDVRCALMRNSRNRIYSFASLDARLRRSWIQDSGSCHFTVRDSTWMKAAISSETVRIERSELFAGLR